MNQISRWLLVTLVLLLLAGCADQNAEPLAIETAEEKTFGKPNVVVFYIDDLGYGDVGSYGAVGVETPVIDRLATEGVRFTDAHSSAATCTPSRYSLLTGEHGFRSNAAILPGDAPALIRPGKATLASMFKKAGYTTAVVGKWHLGLGDGNVDWNTDISPGPLDIGFDYSFLLPATGDRVPTVYLEDRNVVNLDPADPIIVSYKKKVGNRPTRLERPDLARVVADKQHSQTIINGVSRIGTMGGGESALWVDEEFPDVFTGKAVEFIRANKNKPFFLFKSYHDIHVPRLPHPRFQGKSTMGPRGDAIAQMDWMTGRIIEELETLGIADNTLVIFTSDNGPVLNDGYEDEAVEKLGEHKPAGPFRGGKYSAYEAGTRVPTIVWWPGTVKPAVVDTLFSQIDVFASLARLADVELAEGEAMDSLDTLDVMLGLSGMSSRVELIEENVVTPALRDGDWKLIPAIPKGKKGGFLEDKGIESGRMRVPQLYNLSKDPGEQNNLAGEYPDRVEAMQARIDKIMKEGYGK